MTDKKTKKKPRRVYKDEHGNKLPSVTEILGGLGWKYGPLMQWANRIGREGKTLQEGSRDAMKIGSIAHDLIEAFVLGQTIPERGDIPRDLYEPAFHCYGKFVSWWREQDMPTRFELLGSEVAMVDRALGVGGTADLVGTVDGVATMLDYKTGKSIHAETAIQLEAYCHLWEVNGHCQSHDSEGEEIPDALRIAREYNRRIERCAIIHVPVEGPVRMAEIPQDVRVASREIWMHLASMQRHKQVFETFGKALREEAKNDDGKETGSESQAPF